MIKFEKAPREALLSDIWKVYIRQEGEEERELCVYTALTNDGDGNSHAFPEEFCREFDGLTYGCIARKTYFASFEADGEVLVRVEYGKKAEKIDIRPERSGRASERSGESVTFVMNPGEKLVVEADGDIFSSLKLFGNTVSVPEDDRKHYVEFGPGYYTEENCEYIHKNEHGVPVIDSIPDDTTVYLQDGAVVCASIVLAGKRNVRICGRGIVSMLDRCYDAEGDFTARPLYGGFRYWALPNILIQSGCRDIEIEGIVLNCEFRGIVLRNCEDIDIRNVKIFTSCVNADGINMVNTRRLRTEDCYIQSADDCIAVYTACDSIPTLADGEYEHPLPVSSDIEVCGSLLFTCARPFMIGGHATGNTEPHDLVENIRFHDIEVLDIASNIYGISKEMARYWSAVFRILSQTQQLVRNIDFCNIRVNRTKGYSGKPFHIEVRGDSSASYTEKGGYRIENVRFENIQFCHCAADMPESVILSDVNVEKEEDYGVDGVIFRNVTYDGVPMEMKEEHLFMEGCVKHVKVYR